MQPDHTSTRKEHNTVRVMVVDDSPYIENFINCLFSKTDNIKLIASAINGMQALEIMKSQPIDVILLDADLPGTDMPGAVGISVIRTILKSFPRTRIILMSGAVGNYASLNVKALAMGASDFIQKPNHSDDIKVFRNALIDKIQTLAQNRTLVNDSVKKSPSASLVETPKPASDDVSYSLRQLNKFVVPRAIAIGSSTGGPEALVKLFSKLANQIRYTPVFITQHMPAAFTASFATHIQEVSKIPCIEPKDGEVIQPCTIYIAPGDFHMVLKRKNDKEVMVNLTKDPPEHFCRPSVNPMLRSLAEVYGRHILTIILTGMGQDGLEGCKAISEAGGVILAQDKSTSVVWGMPGAVATQGLCNAVLPLNDIPTYITNMMGCKL